MMRSTPKAFAIILVLLAGACGTRPPALEPQAELVWPPSPAEARIRYVRSISGPEDLGIVKPFLRRMAELLFGKAEEYLIRPTGVAERDGVLYVADPGAQALWIFDLRARSFIKVGRFGGTALVSPVAVAAKDGNEVFVADSWHAKVFLLNREGALVRTVAEAGLRRPAALVYDDSARRLYVADSAAHRVLVYDQDNASPQIWGRRGSADGEFNYPTHLALDRAGTLLVTDALNFRVQAFDRAGKFLWKLGRHGDGSGDFASPKGVAAGADDRIYVVDALFDAVQIFARAGTYLIAFGQRGTARGQFWLPGGIFVTPEERIYVADTYNQRVQVFEYIGGS